MNDKKNITILPEDKIQLTQQQKNLIEFALLKQLPPEDADFIEKIHKKEKENNSNSDPFIVLSSYFSTKYGADFGMIYLSAITSGRKGYKKTIASIEKQRVKERISKQNS